MNTKVLVTVLVTIIIVFECMPYCTARRGGGGGFGKALGRLFGRGKTSSKSGSKSGTGRGMWYTPAGRPSIQLIFLIIVILIFCAAAFLVIARFVVNHCRYKDEFNFDTGEEETIETGKPAHLSNTYLDKSSEAMIDRSDLSPIQQPLLYNYIEYRKTPSAPPPEEHLMEIPLTHTSRNRVRQLSYPGLSSRYTPQQNISTTATEHLREHRSFPNFRSDSQNVGSNNAVVKQLPSLTEIETVDETEAPPSYIDSLKRTRSYSL